MRPKLPIELEYGPCVPIGGRILHLSGICGVTDAIGSIEDRLNPFPLSSVTGGCGRTRPLGTVEAQTRYRLCGKTPFPGLGALAPRLLVTSVDFTKCRLYKIAS